jgi:multiple sugar transport system substrate-binding protein
LLFYNKDLFDAAGLEYPNSSWTWDDFKAAAAALTQGEDLADKVFGFYADDWWAVYLPAVWQNGGRLYSEDGTTCILDQGEAVEALAWWADFIQQGYSPSPDDLGSLGMGPEDLFINGRLGMFQNGTWNVAWFAEEATFEWSVAVLPKGKQQATTLHLTNYVMASNSAHPDEAWEFLKFLASPEVYTLEAMNYSRGVPPRPDVAQAIAANPPAGASPHSVQTIQVVDEMATYARLPVKIVNWDEFMGDSVEIGLEGLWNGTLTAADAAAQACSAVNPEPLK